MFLVILQIAKMFCIGLSLDVYTPMHPTTPFFTFFNCVEFLPPPPHESSCQRDPNFAIMQFICLCIYVVNPFVCLFFLVGGGG